MSKDERKEFVFQIVHQSYENTSVSKVYDSNEVNQFLDDGNCATLIASCDKSNKVHFSNVVSYYFFN